jgi:alkanesulfonate monooxygenase SsuD/methylene tetrahydromethanopterin reductase-like flavin-dependent oxidoreductase (luciferase family)
LARTSIWVAPIEDTFIFGSPEEMRERLQAYVAR